MDTFGSKLRKTAEEMAERLNDAAQNARERIGEMNEINRLNAQLRTLAREKDRCKITMADLLIRMFDQNTFAEALLRPEYERIREIDTAITVLEEARAQVTAGDEKPVPTPTQTEAPAPVIPIVEEEPTPTMPAVEEEMPPIIPIVEEETPPSTTYEE